MTIKGPYDDNYIKTDQLNVETTVWSPCGLEGLLNINSEVRLSPQDNSQKALLTVSACAAISTFALLTFLRLPPPI